MHTQSTEVCRPYNYSSSGDRYTPTPEQLARMNEFGATSVKGFVTVKEEREYVGCMEALGSELD